MGKLSLWLVVSSLTLSCSPAENPTSGLEKWSKYQDPMSTRGLQTKPIDVRYGAKRIYVNGKNLDATSALRLLGRSRDLSPVPDILVSIEEDSYRSAVPFLRAISDEGLCDEAKCRFKLVK
jgi:hypothetical protein